MKPSWKFKIPWRTIQIGINLVTVVFGMCTFMPLGYLTRYFSQRCILYADVRVTYVNVTYLSVDIVKSIWGPSSDCSYVTYTPVIAAIHAFIWSWFILLMKGQLKKDRNEIALLLPSFLMNSIVSVCVFVAASIISAGANTFCYNLVRRLEARIPDQTFTCSETEDIRWNIFETKHQYFTFLLVAKISGWILTISCLCQTLVCGYRLYCWILPNTDCCPTTYKHVDGSTKDDVSNTCHYQSSNGAYDDTISFNNDVITFESDRDSLIDKQTLHDGNKNNVNQTEESVLIHTS